MNMKLFTKRSVNTFIIGMVTGMCMISAVGATYVAERSYKLGQAHALATQASYKNLPETKDQWIRTSN